MEKGSARFQRAVAGILPGTANGAHRWIHMRPSRRTPGSRHISCAGEIVGARDFEHLHVTVGKVIPEKDRLSLEHMPGKLASGGVALTIV